MIQAEIQICTVDGKIVEDSHVYKITRRLLGKNVADKLTLTIVVPPDDGS